MECKEFIVGKGGSPDVIVSVIKLVDLLSVFGLFNSDVNNNDM